MIIPEDNNKEKQINNEINEEFNIKKFSKYKTDDNILGWIDNNILLLKNKKELNRIDYRYNLIHAINNNSDVHMGVLSPDGSSLVYYTEHVTNMENKVDIRFYLLNINSQKTKLIYIYQAIALPYTKFGWSEKSRYISFIVEKNHKNYLMIYNTVSGCIQEIKIITKNSDNYDFYIFIDAVVSNDGKEISLVYYYNRVYYSYHKQIQKENILIDNTERINLTEEFYYRDYNYLKGNNLIYLDDNHNLYMYNSNT
ncbi:hypothetical protein BD780_002566 [Clostridium tetanomorphum]|uniref:Uncharacterized protein n=1 Tax=Clostridium tetanomorphum TaxID=1553 RepID=A0A923EDK7_CLOTT|nr:hypothetical protein [Clostridium tetanomorphum]KAJ51202.1 hypothetical protein CTM_14073 [Clostridium tetanomorphum DSM 665]MBC2400146.1 hypothetical protein [Clostridium tetanomorphum]MBP1866560.1 hypothetical protein [Clostridium tetanomorphum]NRS85341.1 hypothetical protein [Clostridium tetanomorphum]NRZ98520.1 hypothetical protein [Clostridium tetanomorphum]